MNKPVITHKRMGGKEMYSTLCGRSSFDKKEWRDDWKDVTCPNCIKLKGTFGDFLVKDSENTPSVLDMKQIFETIYSIAYAIETSMVNSLTCSKNENEPTLETCKHLTDIKILCQKGIERNGK